MAADAEIRLATQEDWPEVRKLLRFTFAEMEEKHGVPSAYDLACQATSFGIQNGEAVYVAESNAGDLVGYVAWVGGLPSAPAGTVFGVGTYVLPKYRRTGVSDALRAAAISHCRERGYLRVEGQAHRDNRAGIDSCLKLGFEIEAYVMVLKL